MFSFENTVMCVGRRGTPKPSEISRFSSGLPEPPTMARSPYSVTARSIEFPP